MSKFELMLHKKATININCGPFSLNKNLKGSQNPRELFLILITYEPITIKTTPANPYVFGISPNIKGEEIRRKRGVKEETGDTKDISELLMAFTYNISVIILIIPLAVKATQKLELREEGISIKNSSGRKRGIAKNLKAQETIYSLMFLIFSLIVTSFRDALKATNKE